VVGGLRRALIGLCVTEITSWGVLYYAFPVMLTRVADDTGWTTGAAMGAYSTGLVMAALAGVPVGRMLDRYGPRRVMTAGSVAGVVAALAVAAPAGGALLADWLGYAVGFCVLAAMIVCGAVIAFAAEPRAVSVSKGV
jgi:MFS family permease